MRLGQRIPSPKNQIRRIISEKNLVEKGGTQVSYTLRGAAQDARITNRAGRRLLIGTGIPAIDATT